MTYRIVAIPLNRPVIHDFLMPPQSVARGAQVEIVGQRPTVAAEQAWLQRLTQSPTLDTLLWRDDPHNNLRHVYTDRLVPVEFLQDDQAYLTRNLGGWAAVYFGVIGADDAQWDADPLLQSATILSVCGADIHTFGADRDLVQARFHAETGCTTPTEAAAHLVRLYRQPQTLDFIERLYATIADGTHFADDNHPPIPRPFLLDALLGALVRLEQRRRDAVADGDQATAATISAWQQKQREVSGLHLILKGEYIMGRHRRSTVLIAPELGVVVKQPGTEPFHEAALNHVTHDGKGENWPRLTRDGALVTPCGRLRLTIEQGMVEKLDRAFGRDVQLMSLFGLIIEPYVAGATLQDYVLHDHERLTPEIYEMIVLHQQVCEALHVENGDWHSANFMRDGDQWVHVDWGAARPLKAHEMTAAGRQARLDQVHNLAFSFHDNALAAQVMTLHHALLDDDERLGRIKRAVFERIERIQT